MTQFWIKAVWDSEAEVYISESNIKGLHLEGATLPEFQEAVLTVAPELIADNHVNQIATTVQARWEYYDGRQPISENLQPA